jgi:hypothetical protein
VPRDIPKKEEARELKEKLEVCCDSPPFRQKAVLTPSRKGKWGKQFKREKKGKKAEKAMKAPKEDAPKCTEIATAAPVRTESICIPFPTTQGSSSGGGNVDNDENIPPMDGSSGWINAHKLPSFSTLSSIEMLHSPGRLVPDGKTTSSEFPPYFDELPGR